MCCFGFLVGFSGFSTTTIQLADHQRTPCSARRKNWLCSESGVRVQQMKKVCSFEYVPIGEYEHYRTPCSRTLVFTHLWFKQWNSTFEPMLLYFWFFFIKVPLPKMGRVPKTFKKTIFKQILVIFLQLSRKNFFFLLSWVPSFPTSKKLSNFFFVRYMRVHGTQNRNWNVNKQQF